MTPLLFEVEGTPCVLSPLRPVKACLCIMFVGGRPICLRLVVEILL